MTVCSVGFSKNTIVGNPRVFANKPKFSGESNLTSQNDIEEKGNKSSVLLVGLAAAAAIAAGVCLVRGRGSQSQKILTDVVNANAAMGLKSANISSIIKSKKCIPFTDVQTIAGKCCDKTGKPFTGKVVRPITSDGKAFYVTRYSAGEPVKSYTFLTRNGKTAVSEIVDGGWRISRDVKPDGFGSWRNRLVSIEDGVQAPRAIQYKDGKIATKVRFGHDGSTHVTFYKDGVKNFSELTAPDGTVKRFVYREGIETIPNVSLKTGKNVISKQPSKTAPYEVQSCKKLENGSMEISYTTQEGTVVREVINPNQ